MPGDLDSFLAEGIQRMRLDKDEVDDLVTGIKQMKVITPVKVMSAFDKILAARGKKGQQRKQQGGAKKPVKKQVKKPKKKPVKKQVKKTKKKQQRK